MTKKKDSSGKDRKRYRKPLLRKHGRLGRMVVAMSMAG